MPDDVSDSPLRDERPLAAQRMQRVLNDFESALPTVDSTCWHYTDTRGLLGVLDSGECWASAMCVLNDSAELSYGRNVVRSTWSDLRSHYGTASAAFIDTVLHADRVDDADEGLFIFSASLDRDLLNQWQHYSSNAGYAVGFDPSVALALRMPANAVAVVRPREGVRSGWVPVEYNESRQRDLARSLIDCADAFAREVIAADGSYRGLGDVVLKYFFRNLVCRFKHPAFAPEREVRFVAHDQGASLAEQFRTDFRGGLIPYVALVPRPAHWQRADLPVPASIAAPALPIRAVVAGPSTGAVSDDVLRRLLRARGYPDVTVERSALPFRP